MKRDGLLTKDKQQVDRILVNPNISTFAAKLCNLSVSEYLLSPEKAFMAQTWAKDMLGHDSGPGYFIHEWVNWDFGGEVEFSRNPIISLPKSIKRAIEDEKDILNIKLPDPRTAPGSSRILEFNRICAKNGFGVGIPGGSPLGIVRMLVGVEKMLRWMVKKPELIHNLLRIATDYLFKIANIYIEEFGVEKIAVGTAYPLESHSLMSPKQFEKFSLIYIKEIFEKFNSMGLKKWVVHLCGDHTNNLVYWKNEIPLAKDTIFTLGSEMNMKEISKYFGDKYAIGGNLKNELLELGNPNEVYKEAKKIILENKYLPGGFVLMPDCDLSTNVPPSNVYAMVKAARDFGEIEY